jgi:hypothetical protein
MKYESSDKNRFLSVIEGEIPDRVPNFEVLIERPVTSYILGRETIGTFEWPPMNPYDYIELVKKIGQDFIGINFYGFPYLPDDGTGNPVLLNKLSEEKRVAGPFVKGCNSEADIKKLYVGPLKTFDLHINFLRPYWESYISAIKGTSIGIFGITGMVFQSIYQFTLGFENFMLLLYDNLPFIEYLLDVSADYNRRIVEFLCDYPIDMLYIGDDVAFRNGLIVQPDLFLKLWTTRMEKVIEPAKQKGIPIIFHSDGNIYEIIPTLIDMGFKCLNPIEPYGMDIYEVKEKWGNKIALMGNMDIAGVLAFGTPEEVIADTQNHLEKLMPGGKYIAASSHSITRAIPPENFLAMIAAVHTYGRY